MRWALMTAEDSAAAVDAVIAPSSNIEASSLVKFSALAKTTLAWDMGVLLLHACVAWRISFMR
jgi:hypothetical protein